MPPDSWLGNPATRHYEIAVTNVDGTGTKRLTNNIQLDHYLAWSPDGSLIAFIANPQEYYPRNGGQLYTMAADGTDVQLLTPSLDTVGLFPPVWSPDGQRIAVVVNEGDLTGFGTITPMALYLIDADGSRAMRVAQTFGAPTWAPDGSELAFISANGSGEKGVYAVRPDMTGLRLITPRSASRISWSPDGSEILLYSGAVHVVRPDGTGLRQLDVTRWPLHTILASWSPDGARIVIHYWRDDLNGPGDNLVFTIKRDGTDLRLIARRELEFGQYGYSHWEGRWVAARQARDDISRDLAACGQGFVVPQPEENPELVKECETLLRLRDTLAGSAELAWNALTPIGDWEGITIGGTPLRVQALTLQDRGLTGSLPPELGQLTDLRKLDASNTGYTETVWNVLTGSIPPELSNLKKLQTLDLSRNFLSGSIPPELGDLMSLESLELENNLLSGALPEELSKLTNLEVLILRHNRLSGEIPAVLGQQPSLRALDLSDNQLVGSIPPGLGEFLSLRRLNLSRNRLSGDIPPELGSIASLWYLHLDDNMLTGSIPPQLGQLAQLDGLYLQRNSLTGSIPAELGQLTSLRWLHLEHNELTGSIPVELRALTNLDYPGLLPNTLSGCLSAELPEEWVMWSGLPRCES